MANEITIKNESGDIKKEWDAGVTDRRPYLDRAKLNATLTLKYLYPDADTSSDTSTIDLTGDWQVDGPILTNHLANLYMETLFPPHQSFFKLSLPAGEMEKLKESGGLSETAVEFALSRMENETRKLMLNRGGRPALLDAIKHIIVAGNSLIYYPEEGNIQNYALDEFIVERDPDGNVTLMITKDSRNFLTLPENVKTVLRSELNLTPEDEAKTNIDLFTRIKISPDNKDGIVNPLYVVQQAADVVPLPESEVVMAKDELRWIPIGWHRTRREYYYRSLVELIYPALYNVSVLSEAIIKGVAVITDIKFTVEPDSIIDIPTMNSSGPGTYHYGSKDDINPVNVGSIGDWAFIKSLIDMFVEKLSKIFLMTYTRNAERVTAEEIRLTIRELETSHGGVFGNLAQTLQSQLGRLLLKGINADINETNVELTVLTGLDAMGRKANNDNMRAFAEDLSVYDSIPEAFKGLIKPREIFVDMATGRDVDYTRWTMTPSELEGEEKKRRNAQTSATLVEGAAKGMGQQVANMEQGQALDLAEGLTNE